MKLLVLSFLAMAGMACSLAVSPTNLANALQIRDENICRAVPRPISGATAAVCQVSNSGGTCGGCDIMWASYNVCKCKYQPFPSNEECMSLYENARACERNCAQSCTNRHPQANPVFNTICARAHSGSNYFECDGFRASCNIWNCYGSVYYPSGGNMGGTSGLIFCRAAQQCETVCDRSGRCRRH